MLGLAGKPGGIWKSAGMRGNTGPLSSCTKPRWSVSLWMTLQPPHCAKTVPDAKACVPSTHLSRLQQCRPTASMATETHDI